MNKDEQLSNKDKRLSSRRPDGRLKPRRPVASSALVHPCTSQRCSDQRPVGLNSRHQSSRLWDPRPAGLIKMTIRERVFDKIPTDPVPNIEVITFC